MKTILLSINKILNGYLAIDPQSIMRLQRLQGKVMQIECALLSLTIYCLFRESDTVLQTEAASPPDITIRGTPLQLLSVMLAKDKRRSTLWDDLTITGDAELGQQVADLFHHVHIDWEEYVARLIGDIPTHYLSRFMRTIHQWQQATRQSMIVNIDEYLHEEANWLPPAEALRDFFSDIDTLRMDTDRLEMRITHLQTLLITDKESS
jgi:ubiquinone biosynthesis protein UbiJ